MSLISDAVDAIGGVVNDIFGGGGQTVGGGLVNAGLGAGIAALTGGNPGIGALTGGVLGLTGNGLGTGPGGFANSLLNTLGIGGITGAYPSQVAGDAISAPGTVSLTDPLTGQAVDMSNPNAGQVYAPPAGTAPGMASSVSGGIDQTGRNLGVLEALAQAISRPSASDLARQGYNAAMNTPSGRMFNTPLQSGNYLNRSQVSNYQPNSGSYYTYGEVPEPQFFNNNQVNLPSSGTGGMARGGALTMHREPFSTGSHGHYLDGDDPGMDDTRNAALSDGEYVYSAQDTANFGDGNNKAGARVLDHMRKAVAEDKGFKHPIPPKMKKSPLNYLKEARKEVLGHA